ncbi:PREDICTED: translation initiation factor IF-2-like [Chinchilla lanigera]|uniref:translation initiation factor IF-2-like n=1 Tax=Chinchilla lanigera TaxID=34839 RepID=UPI00069854EF|nr:PREDICTED: translation initiation factor IF-2-like [Chinchilla lanigera]XP_013376014.1 PREDICTED: translation initiation factor IF-2-like [Chinchilla lanigera]
MQLSAKVLHSTPEKAKTSNWTDAEGQGFCPPLGKQGCYAPADKRAKRVECRHVTDTPWSAVINASSTAIATSCLHTKLKEAKQVPAQPALQHDASRRAPGLTLGHKATLGVEATEEPRPAGSNGRPPSRPPATAPGAPKIGVGLLWLPGPPRAGESPGLSTVPVQRPQRDPRETPGGRVAARRSAGGDRHGALHTQNQELHLPHTHTPRATGPGDHSPSPPRHPRATAAHSTAALRKPWLLSVTARSRGFSASSPHPRLTSSSQRAQSHRVRQELSPGPATAAQGPRDLDLGEPPHVPEP